MQREREREIERSADTRTLRSRTSEEEKREAGVRVCAAVAAAAAAAHTHTRRSLLRSCSALRLPLVALVHRLASGVLRPRAAFDASSTCFFLSRTHPPVPTTGGGFVGGSTGLGSILRENPRFASSRSSPTGFNFNFNSPIRFFSQGTDRTNS